MNNSWGLKRDLFFLVLTVNGIFNRSSPSARSATPTASYDQEVVGTWNNRAVTLSLAHSGGGHSCQKITRHCFNVGSRKYGTKAARRQLERCLLPMASLTDSRTMLGTRCGAPKDSKIFMPNFALPFPTLWLQSKTWLQRA